MPLMHHYHGKRIYAQRNRDRSNRAFEINLVAYRISLRKNGIKDLRTTFAKIAKESERTKEKEERKRKMYIYSYECRSIFSECACVKLTCIVRIVWTAWIQSTLNLPEMWYFNRHYCIIKLTFDNTRPDQDNR